MAQISLETITFAAKLAKKSLRSKEDLEICEELRNEPNNSRLLCPFCKYTSPKNKMSAIVKNDIFKCFSCGITRRVR